MKKVNLSKSKYLVGLQCLKRLYLQCHRPELAGEVDEQQQAIFDQGKAVGIQAQKMFSEGVLLREDYFEHKEAVEHTKELIADKVSLRWQQTNLTPASPRSGKRITYQCPVCSLKAWAKDGAELICGTDQCRLLPETLIT